VSNIALTGLEKFDALPFNPVRTARISEGCNHAKSRAWEIASRFIDANTGSPSIFMNEN
jgi:hypothetical protein